MHSTHFTEQLYLLALAANGDLYGWGYSIGRSPVYLQSNIKLATSYAYAAALRFQTTGDVTIAFVTSTCH